MGSFTNPTFRMTDEIGVSGITHYGKRSRVEDEWHPNLRGPLAVRVYREMRDNDATIGGAANIIEQMLSQVKWRVVPANKTARAQEAAKLVEQSFFEDMNQSFSELMSDVLSMLWYGWASFEKVYKVRNGVDSKFTDNRIGLRGLFIRGQDTLQAWQWDLERGDEVLGWWQQAWTVQSQPVFLPMEKLVHFRTTSNRANPEGRSLLRNAYRSWFFMKRLQETEGVGFERNLEGLPVLRLPDIYWSTKKADRAIFDRMVQLIRRNDHMGLTFPASEDKSGKTGFDIELLTAAGAGAVMQAIRAAIVGYQREVATNFNTQFQQLGANGTGSYALSSDQTNLFGVGLGALLRIIRDTLNNDPVSELQEFNGYRPEERAKLAHSDVEKPDVAKFSKAMVDLANAQLLIPDRGVRNVVRELLSLEPEPEDAELDMDQGAEDEEDAAVMADELMPDDEEEDTAKSRTGPVPPELREFAKEFLRRWEDMNKKKRINSVLMLARAKMLARGTMPAEGVEAMKRFFAKNKRPRRTDGAAWQYWEASGGDLGRAWVQGK
jgi:hypothetical protein